MKKLLLSAAALTLMFTACKKDDENSTPANSWKVGSKEYTSMATAGSALGSNYSLIASTGTGTSADGIWFTFSGATAPTAGTYKVVNDAATLSANEVSFTTIGATGTTVTYSSTGSVASNATVTVNGGKVSISMPATWATNDANSKDSVQVTANITQTN